MTPVTLHTPVTGLISWAALVGRGVPETGALHPDEARQATHGNAGPPG